MCCLRIEMKKNQFCFNLLQSHMEIYEDFPENLRNLPQLSRKRPQNYNSTMVILPLFFRELIYTFFSSVNNSELIKI